MPAAPRGASPRRPIAAHKRPAALQRPAGHPPGPLLITPTSRGRAPRERFDGRLAQLVEQLTLNQRVVGSSPTAPTIKAPIKAAFLVTLQLGSTAVSRKVLLASCAHGRRGHDDALAESVGTPFALPIA